MDNRIKLLIVDDSLTIRAMMEQVIGRDGDIDIVGVASSGEHALDMIAHHDVDVVTIDIAMPGMNGLALVEQVVAGGKAVPLVVSGHVQRRVEAIQRGAMGFFDKSRLMPDNAKLLTMIKQAGRGKLRRPDESEAA